MIPAAEQKSAPSWVLDRNIANSAASAGSAAGALRPESVFQQRDFQRVAVVALQLDGEALHGSAGAQAALQLPREGVQVEAAFGKALEDDELPASAPLL